MPSQGHLMLEQAKQAFKQYYSYTNSSTLNIDELVYESLAKNMFIEELNQDLNLLNAQKILNENKYISFPCGKEIVFDPYIFLALWKKNKYSENNSFKGVFEEAHLISETLKKEAQKEIQHNVPNIIDAGISPWQYDKKTNRMEFVLSLSFFDILRTSTINTTKYFKIDNYDTYFMSVFSGNKKNKSKIGNDQIPDLLKSKKINLALKYLLHVVDSCDIREFMQNTLAYPNNNNYGLEMFSQFEKEYFNKKTKKINLNKKELSI